MIRKFLRALFHAVLRGDRALRRLAAWILYPPPARQIAFPDGKRFAFSIVDDTDMATLARNRPVYDVCTVWPAHHEDDLDARAERDRPRRRCRGHAQHPAYREFIVDLQRKGFEIAMHGVRGGSSRARRHRAGLEAFEGDFGQIRGCTSTIRQPDNLYWGGARWSFGPFAWTYVATSQQSSRARSRIAVFLG